MSGRESAAVLSAVEAVQAGASLRSAAKAAGVALTSVRRAMRRRGEPPRPQGQPVPPADQRTP